MRSVWKREMQSYFHTAAGYVFMGVFLLVSSVLFFLQIMKPRSGDLLSLIGTMSYLWMLLSPVLTMRLLAEEKQQGTDQLLLTSPISPVSAVLGKYFAAVTVMTLTACMTLAYVVVVALYGRVYPAEMAVGYLGFLLEGAAFLSLDLMISGIARTPVTAAIMAFGANFCLWILDVLADAVSYPWLTRVLSFFSLYGRNEPFLMGQLSFSSILFDLCFTAVFLLLAVRRFRGR